MREDTVAALRLRLPQTCVSQSELNRLPRQSCATQSDRMLLETTTRSEESHHSYSISMTHTSLTSSSQLNTMKSSATEAE